MLSTIIALFRNGACVVDSLTPADAWFKTQTTSLGTLLVLFAAGSRRALGSTPDANARAPDPFAPPPPLPPLPQPATSRWSCRC